MKLNIKTRLYSGFAIAILLVILVGVISYNTFKEQLNEASSVRHSYKVINQLVDVQNILVDMETGRRGFRSTNEKKFLEPYYIGLSKIESELFRTRQLVEDNPRQSNRFVEVQDNVIKMLAFWKELGEDASKYTRDTIITINTIEKARMDTLRHQFKEIEKAEMRLLAESENSNRRLVDYAVYELFIGISLILLIVGVLIYFILKEFKSRTRAEHELKANNAELVVANHESAEKNWLLAGLAEVNDCLQGSTNTRDLCDKILGRIVSYLDIKAAALYLYQNENNGLKLTSSIGLPAGIKQDYKINEGLVGQAATSAKPFVIKNIPAKYINVESGVATLEPKEALYAPLLLNNEIKGVIELLTFETFETEHVDFINLVDNNIVVAILSVQSREEILELLAKVQQQKEELENQQEELRQANEELSVQTEVLQSSEEELRVQEEELRQINAELEEKNEAIETARQALMLKAKELEATSKYKSEFLAIMSHELRTPLNSVLILAKLLADNKGQNLTEKQVSHARIIHKSGTDLLQLINDILDLSKIEAGKVELNIQPVSLPGLAVDMEQLFGIITEEKSIHFKVDIDADVPPSIITDKQKLEQVLKNLLSNAIKFTAARGAVVVNVRKANMDGIDGICFSVEDNGIGISENKQQLIFEAFKQADGSTSRKYGGTGLGLSITKELVHLLGGKILLKSEEGIGSTFSILLPLKISPKTNVVTELNDVQATNSSNGFVIADEYLEVEDQQVVADDRNNIEPNDKVILIVEDDEPFAAILRDIAREKGFKTLVAIRGDEGFNYAARYLPQAIILDMQLPVINGRELLKMLKSNKNLKHIPVHIVSAADEQSVDPTAALAFLKKPVQPKDIGDAMNLISEYLQSSVKRVLLITGEHLKDQLIQQLFDQRRFDIKCDLAETINSAIQKMAVQHYDCIIADIGSDTDEGIEQLKKLRRQVNAGQVPLIIYLDKDISAVDEMELKKLSEVIVRKSSGSYNRLMDELELFLYKVHEEKNMLIPAINGIANGVEKELKEKNVLVVDDDMRNVFALTSALESEDIRVITASDGKDALNVLKQYPEIDMVLMDIMMPEMDGYEAIRFIRNDMKLQSLPIIALTAKAMTGDREKCIQAGASDYITKPVDLKKLISLMRVWLS